MTEINLKINPNIGQTFGKKYDFEIYNLKNILIDILKLLETDVEGFTPIGLRINQDFDNRNKYSIEIYVRDERFFIS